jgi:hypothetical protein
MNYARPVGSPRASAAHPVRLLVIGDRSGIRETIDQLCTLGFSDHSDWSDIMPKPDSSEFMSIMTKWRMVN